MDSEKYIIVPEIGEIPSFPVKTIALEDWRDGLLVRTPNWLGDAVMAVPAIMMLKQILPPCTGLFILTTKGIAPLFKAMPFVDRVITVSDPHAFMTARERRRSCSTIPSAMRSASVFPEFRNFSERKPADVLF